MSLNKIPRKNTSQTMSHSELQGHVLRGVSVGSKRLWFQPVRILKATLNQTLVQ
jgi:hypothetical protein